MTVTNTPGVLTEDTADMTVALILASARRLVEGAGVVQSGGFHGWSPDLDDGAPASGASGWASSAWAGSVQAVARRAKAFGLVEVHYHNRKPVAKKREVNELERDLLGLAWTRCWRGWT